MAGTNRGTMFGPGIYMADAVRRALSCCRVRAPVWGLNGVWPSFSQRGEFTGFSCRIGRGLGECEGPGNKANTWKTHEAKRRAQRTNGREKKWGGQWLGALAALTRERPCFCRAWLWVKRICVLDRPCSGRLRRATHPCRFRWAGHQVYVLA